MDEFKTQDQEISLDLLFSYTITLGVSVITYGFDGKKAWEIIKKELTQFNHSVSGWILPEETKKLILSHLTPVDKMSDKPKKGESDTHHFLRQHVRMTCKQPTLEFIIQLAFNIGQWMGKNDKTIMNELDYKGLGLYKLTTYISQEDIETFQKLPYEINKMNGIFSGNT